MSDSIEQLKTMGATGITFDVNESGIIRVCFTLNGVQIHAQADLDNAGIYAIEVPSLQGLAKLINKGESL